ncbi:hypothetical protein B9Z55_006080 [Caenorhabditis nigoni]|uniref:C2H2-type domain-containing protein n=1 Tax=Caenorhabditis nigoni TaxID=1611254 RepID=A0A2G5V3K7_9PELO|nr:hypothetical protein B9Z55_006080 [Caenorhabditis nigoni]
MMANAVDMQQILMSMDPTSNQFNVMKMTNSGGSASPTSSSGAPSSSSILAEADEKEQFLQSQMLQAGQNQWMQMLLQQQQQQQNLESPTKAKSAEDLMQNPSAIMELLGGTTDFMKIAAKLTQQKQPVDQPESEEPRDSSPSPTPAVSLNSQLASMILPTTSTSTGCSAASTTSSVDSAASSVIVNGHVSAPHSSASVDDDDLSMQPSAKKQKSEESETPLTPNHQLMQSLLAQIGLSTPVQQGNQKKDPNEMMLQNFFPQSLALPLMFPGNMHSQFGMQDFESLSALSTPNKGAGVKRQYSSNGKNYCDICNKEVCNKYFLRTHMLKMHGIVIDENKTVIANIDTSIKEREGELTFRCDTCRTMFKTRNQLRQHRQDVHGVLPLSTPRNNQNKPSVPNTPNGATNNSSSGPNSASMGEEKCQLCDKRFAPAMMGFHVMQEHMGTVGGSNGSADISRVLSMLNQANTRGQSVSEEKELGMAVLECPDCSYKCKDPKNLEMHMERHEKMNDAKIKQDDDEDVALKLTTEAALHMVVQNQNQFDGDSAALNLTFKNADGIKKDMEEEKNAIGNQNHERNSHTSGSISPSGSLSDAYENKNAAEKLLPTQTVLVRCHDENGQLPAEFLVRLPVRSQIDGPRKIVFELLPTPVASS